MRQTCVASSSPSVGSGDSLPPSLFHLRRAVAHDSGSMSSTDADDIDGMRQPAPRSRQFQQTIDSFPLPVAPSADHVEPYGEPSSSRPRLPQPPPPARMPKLRQLVDTTWEAELVLHHNFGSRSCRVILVDGVGRTLCTHVHKDILMRLPYFEAMLRWNTEDAQADALTPNSAELEITLQLPPLCRCESFGVLLHRLYSLYARWTAQDWLGAFADACLAAALWPEEANITGSSPIPKSKNDDGLLEIVVGVFLLAKQLLVHETILTELLNTVLHTVRDDEDVAIVRRLTAGFFLPEFEVVFGRAYADLVDVDLATLQDGARSAIKGSDRMRALVDWLLIERQAAGKGSRDYSVLLEVLGRPYEYERSNCTFHDLDAASRIQSAIPPMLAWLEMCELMDCGHLRVIHFPQPGFSWMFNLVLERFSQDCSLFMEIVNVFKNLQWLERDVRVNSRREESPNGERSMFKVLSPISWQGLRQAFATLLRKGLSHLRRGRISEEDYCAAFDLCLLSGDDVVLPPQVRRIRNALHFSPVLCREWPCASEGAGVMGHVDILSVIFSQTSRTLRNTIMDKFLFDFTKWEAAFTADAVRHLGADQQLQCVRACTLQWLTGDICNVLRGRSRIAARNRLAPYIGFLPSGLHDFMAEGLQQARRRPPR